MADTSLKDRLLKARLGAASQAAEQPEVQPLSVDIGGATIQLPGGSTPEQVQSAIQGFRETPEFDALLDKEEGAPARVRMSVGGVPLEDRLETLKLFYPDAAAHGEDNFVFSDPATGNPA